MAAHDKVRWHPPLKASALEVVDLLSDTESTDTPLESGEHEGKYDAYEKVVRAQEVANGDVQWHSPLKAPAIEIDNLPPREVSTVISEVLAQGDDAEPGDASSEGNDSDEDSQWSLYEDALGDDEDEVALSSSTVTLH